MLPLEKTAAADIGALLPRAALTCQLHFNSAVSSLWSSGTAVEVHAEGPVSIPIASKDVYTDHTDLQTSVGHPTNF